MKEKLGFKCVNSQQVYISKVNPPRKEVLKTICDVWNNDKTIQKLRGHIKKLSIVSGNSHQSTVFTGSYYKNERKVKLRIYPGMPSDVYKQTLIHEVVGDAFWYWAEKRRKEEWREFNDFVKKLPPINHYIRSHERKWKKMKRLTEYTVYENEQHSAATEIMYGLDGYDFLHVNLLSERQTKELLEKWKKLHY